MLDQRLSLLDQRTPTWLVESLRWTTFLSPSAGIEEDWWSRVTGTPSEAKISRPRLAGYQEQGLFDGKLLLLTVLPKRVDWQLSLAVRPEETLPDFPSIGAIAATVPPFLQLIRRWLEIAPHVERLAFGGVLLLPVDDPKMGYRKLSETFLRTLPIDVEGSSDFFYQINRPRVSRTAITGLRVNRLSKWSVGLYQRLMIGLTVGAGESTAEKAEGAQLYACRLELDISTAPEFPSELPREQLHSLSDELVELGLEIALEGDVK